MVEIVQWFSYCRQGSAGVVALRRSPSGFFVDWLLQDHPPAPEVLSGGYLSSLAATETFGGGEHSARRRFARLKLQLAGHITREGEAIRPRSEPACSYGVQS